MITIAVSGSIGTGKTTLCDTLSVLTGWNVVREDVGLNPFLGPFYDDMPRWALASQIQFMLTKTRKFEELASGRSTTILIDRTIEEDFKVFCSTLKEYEIVNMSEFELLNEFFLLLNKTWLVPDVYVYLEGSPERCFERILNRGYAGDSKIELGYVRRISDKYREWRGTIVRRPILVFDADQIDFRKQTMVHEILTKIRSEIGTKRD
jgi:deoxyadenosine/deoxycytidine kinase